MSFADLVESLVDNRRLVLVALFVVTIGLYAGVSMVEETTSLEDFQTASAEADALEYVDENFAARGGGGTPVQLVAQSENVLERETMLSILELQQELRADDEIEATLVEDDPIVGVPNVVAQAAIERERAATGQTAGTPAQEATLEEQHAQLESMSDGEVEQVVEAVLDEDADRAEVFALLPRTYEPGSSEASATIVVLFQDTGGEGIHASSVPDHLVESQLSIQDLATSQEDPEYAVFGYGLVSSEIDAASGDSMLVLGPFVFVFVLAALLIAYRDILDVLLGLVGLVMVLVWTVGFMGWVGFDFSIIFIAVPVLLVALGVDYAIHVVMRYREARADNDTGVSSGMAIGLGSVGVALVYVTATTVTGFLSNVVSPVGPIREFGIVSAAGIFASLVVFGVFLPLAKIELDDALESRGFDRRKRAFGTGRRLRPLLLTGERIARRAPLAVVLVVLVVGGVGFYAGANVDTSFETEEFLPESPPEWTDNLPDSRSPGTYTQAATIDLLTEQFVRQELTTQILVEGDVTREDTLERVAAAEAAAAESPTTAELPTGEKAVRGPFGTMERVASQNESFNETFTGADTTGDGVPDTDLETVYAAFFAADERAAAEFVHRDDGEYVALRLVTYADGAYSLETITAEARSSASPLDGDGLRATATGQETVLSHLTERDIGQTVAQSLAITIVVVGVFLAFVYRLTTGRATLGLVTLVPVLFALSGVLGTMYALGLSFNYITGMITSLTVGLGVDYSLHVSERYHQELERCGSVFEALERTVTGTGGALLGSAVTTAGGFGILTLAFLPSLQQFGTIAAVSIVYAFVASVIVLPSLLVYWTRLFGPESREEHESETSESTPAEA
ncbi:efflux RND transporter permease subunit [Natronobiforma cellulositropha]|uniref:efflux RND transporter permease subunit n=1 Tax=Natronobiforma cellulositropha TaxID=1679076 RepID=UPI0021D5CE35|nr:efflux RND transporter permease subunit [Natronobiforma cellulositropha]